MKDKIDKIKSIIEESSIEGVIVMSKFKYFCLLVNVFNYNKYILRKTAKDDPSKILTTENVDVYVNGCLLPIIVPIVKEFGPEGSNTIMFIRLLPEPWKLYCIGRSKLYSTWIQESNGSRKKIRIGNWF